MKCNMFNVWVSSGVNWGLNEVEVLRIEDGIELNWRNGYMNNVRE